MAIKESGEMYLETIYVLSKNRNNVRAIDISEYMGYSKPSVSRAIKVLKEKGYIKVDETGTIILLTEGKKVAQKMYERHTLLTNALESLGIDSTTAQNDACKIEHDISDKTFNAIKKHFNANKKG